MLAARWKNVPAFVTTALRPALSRLPRWATKTCTASPTVAAKNLVTPSRATLRGGGPVLSTLKMSTVSATSNPLMVQDVFPRYSEVKAEHVVPGIKAILAESDKALTELEADLEKRNYDIPAGELLPRLEKMTDHLGRSWGIVQHLKAVKDSDEMRKAVEEMQPPVVENNLRMSQSTAIYKAFKSISESPAMSTLSAAQRRIVESELRDAQLSGVGLEGAKKDRFNEIQQTLAKLSTTFSNNILDATKAITFRITDKEEVKGLPESALGLAAQTAISKGDKDATPEAGPWVFTLDMPSYLPVQQHAANRELREKMYKAYLTRASEQTPAQDGKSLDNSPLINQILSLKKERAELLGFKNHAEVSTAKKMATTESALKLMADLREKSIGAAQKEKEELQAFAEGLGFKGELMPWDSPFYAERQREALYSFSDEDLRPYFSLPKVLDGLFALISRLFQVEVVPAETKAPVWDESVQFWQINRDGKPTAYFYLDPYSRPAEKRGGAWMDECAGRSKVMAPPGADIRLPVAHMVCNQSPPVGDKPSLMTFREVETLFHEMGHALQHMLTTEEEGLVAGIRGVDWDAVEQPSQFMENWCYDRKTVDKLALHYETGERIPDALWEKVKAAKNFRAGSMMMRQLLFAVTDLTLHSSHDPASGVTVHDVYTKVAETYSVTEPMECGPACPHPPARHRAVCLTPAGAQVRPLSLRLLAHLRGWLLRGVLLVQVGRGALRRLLRGIRGGRAGRRGQGAASLCPRHCQCRHHFLFRL